MREDAALRRRTMQAVRGKDTGPELIVRRLARQIGYRYRLHRNDLPGKPDLAFIAKRKVVFVHGCFWHGHDCTRGERVPVHNRTYWVKKITRNKERDAAHMTALKKKGWRVLVVWECVLRDEDRVKRRLHKFLSK